MSPLSYGKMRNKFFRTYAAISEKDLYLFDVIPNLNKMLVEESKRLEDTMSKQDSKIIELAKRVEDINKKCRYGEQE